ncbi:MAG: V-type ATP synthase subunit D [Candidatus Aenigmarchaeota archaeon]|nr:V-type ATP synthase subunit D [Candidatus Aenigmarchaeota archaeon]
MSFYEKNIATRTNLLDLKNQIMITKSSLEILKDKEDTLISEFMQNIKTSKNLRTTMHSKINEGLSALNSAYDVNGQTKTEIIAKSCTPQENIDITNTNVMGVLIPKIKTENISRAIDMRGYPINDTDETIDKTADIFEEALEKTLKCGEIENNIFLIGEEISKTRTKANALEKSIIPDLFSNEKQIKQKLNEIERQEISKIKRIKKMFN